MRKNNKKETLKLNWDYEAKIIMIKYKILKLKQTTIMMIIYLIKCYQLGPKEKFSFNFVIC